ncbi:MAG TPA: suppressor of fused domain protein, partial [Terriglobales bacterium]|nr:suppressor of fused domain protein [Terriglobales bacterium]
MPAETMCPHCSKRYSVQGEHVGKTVTCKGCGQKFVIEDLSGPARSPGRVPVYRPERAAGAGRAVATPTPFLDSISRHIEKTIGPAPSVFHEIVSTDVHIDLHVVPAQPGIRPSQDRPLGGDYVTVVTSGMSSRPMKVPATSKQSGVSEYAELMLALPKNWPGLRPDGTFDQGEMKDESRWWPFRWLKQMARLPHEYGTFFAHGVTVPNGEPAKPFVAGSKLCCWMLFKPLLCLGARQLQIDSNTRIDFFALFAITEREMNLKLNQGPQALVHALADGEVYTELLDVRR